VWQDRRFIDAHMPSLGHFLHYRTVDVSTLKELVKRWYPALELPKKKETHRALDDIRESIQELRFYREHVLR
jgi:oligoribonuclease